MVTGSKQRRCSPRGQADGRPQPGEDARACRLWQCGSPLPVPLTPPGQGGSVVRTMGICAGRAQWWQKGQAMLQGPPPLINESAHTGAPSLPQTLTLP